MPNPDPTIKDLIGSAAAGEVQDGQQKIVLRAPNKLLKPLVSEVLAQHVTLCRKNFGEMYAIPTVDFQSIYRIKPEITLIFYPTKSLNNNDATINYYNKSEISYRIVDKTETTITKQDLSQMKIRINELIGGKNPLIWHKGKTMYLYTDDSLGYRFRMLCIDENEARKNITKIMEIREHTPDWRKLFIQANAEPGITYPDTPDKEQILGEMVTEPRYRREIKVQFDHAELSLHGKKKPEKL